MAAITDQRNVLRFMRWSPRWNKMRNLRRLLGAATVALALTSQGQAQPQPNSAGNKTETQDAQREPPGNTNDSIVRFQEAIDSIARSLEAANEHPNADREQQRAEEDLKAQQDMARWAKLMFFAAVASIILTLVGLRFLYNTMVYTRETLGLTRTTLEEAKAATAAATGSTSAAERSVAMNEVTAKAQLRAYVLPQNAKVIGADPRTLVIGAVFKNTGQTPAKQVRSRISLILLPPNEIDTHTYELEEFTGMGTLGPGQTFTGRFVAADGNPFYVHDAALRRRKLVAIVYGRVVYTDVFDRPQETNFRIWYSPTRQDFSTCDNGNDCT